MKRVSGVIVLMLFAATILFPQQEWQGRVARGGSADFPDEGYYAASNSFARNSVVTVTNPATGKSIRVVISKTLADNGLFMTLSSDAAKALGLEGNLPVTMKAQPVIIPGLAEQSIGGELPFNPDPDINPAASAGDPNAFVYNSGASVQNIRPESSPSPSPSPAVAQASPSPSPALVADVSPSPTPAVVAQVSPSPSPSPVVAQASPSPSPSDVDLGASALIGEPARGNTTNPSPSPSPAGRLNSGSTQPVAAASPSPSPSGQAAGTATQNANPATANAIAESGSNNSVNASPSPTTGTGTLNQGQRGTASNIAGTSPSPSPGTSTIPNATAQSALPGASNSVTASPTAAPSTSGNNAAQTGLAASVQDLRAQQRSGIASGINGSATSLPGNSVLVRPSPSPSPIAQASPSPSPSPQGKIAQGVGDASTPGLSQTQTGTLPGTTTVAQPAGPSTGMSTGIQTLGDGTRDRPNTGDVARPEHLFTPPKNNNSGSSAPTNPLTLASPNVKNAPDVNPSPVPSSNSPADSLLNSQLAALNNRPGQSDLFSNPVGDTLSPSLASSSPVGNPLSTGKLPEVNAPGKSTPESSLAGATTPTGALATGIVAGLPNARLPDQAAPQASNPWLDGPAPAASANGALPLAQVVPNELPQAALKGAGPGITAMPASGDLPMVAVDTSRSTADKGIAGTSPESMGLAAADLPGPKDLAGPTVEDPMSALRPAKTIVSLEPADYRPPVLKQPTSDSVNGVNPATNAVTGDLAEAKAPGKANADASLAGTSSGGTTNVTGDLSSPRTPSGPEQALSATSPNLSTLEAKLAEAQVKGSGTAEQSLGTTTPAGSAVNGTLAEAQVKGTNVESGIAGTNPSSSGAVGGTLAEAQVKTGTADTVLGTGNPPQGTVTGTLAQAQVKNGSTVDNGLILGTPTGTTGNVALADPTASKADTLKGSTTPAGGNVVVGVTTAEPRSPAGTSANTTGNTNSTTGNTSNTGNTTGNTGTNGNTTQNLANLTIDEAWAVSNLPIVKTLQKEQYYLQVGAFANPRSAKRAIDEIALAYPSLVLPEKAGNGNQVYKVYIGPLNEDEKGLILYWLRSKGYRDAFVRKGQP